MVVIMKGSMIIGREAMNSVEIKEGGFFMLPAGMRYTAHTAKECTFLVWGSNSFDIHTPTRRTTRESKTSISPDSECRLGDED